MGFSMIIELPTHVQYQCALCNQTKSLEYLALLTDGGMRSICLECRDVILREESLKQIDSLPLWLTEDEIHRLGPVSIEG